MALVFPDTPANYKAFFKELAEKHQSIRHLEDPSRNNFTVVSLDSLIKGLSDADLRAFLDKTRSGSKAKQTIEGSNCAMILFQKGGEKDNAMIKVNMGLQFASYLILTKPKDKTEQFIDEAYNTANRVGEDIMSAVLHFFKLNYLKGKILTTEDEAARVNDYVGWRWSFTYQLNSVNCYNEEVQSNFKDLTIEELL